MKWVVDTIRVILSIVILVFVWLNAHWSVALSLSLTFSAFEALGRRLNSNFIEIMDVHNSMADQCDWNHKSPRKAAKFRR